MKALEQHLWDLAMLVRGPDLKDRGHRERHQGLALNRCELLRRTLDVRVYEVLLLYTRTRLIWDGIDNDDDDDKDGNEGGGDFYNNSSTRLDVDGGAK